MDNERAHISTAGRMLQDSGLGSLGSESDSSPTTGPRPLSVEQNSTSSHNIVINNNNVDNIESIHARSHDLIGVDEVSGKQKQYNMPSVKSQSKSFLVNYLGNSTLDRRYTQPMLPWVIAEVRNHHKRSMITLEVLDHSLRGTPCESDNMLFDHKLQNLSRFARVHHEPKCFAYLFRPNTDSPFCCHVFEAPDESTVGIFIDCYTYIHLYNHTLFKK